MIVELLRHGQTVLQAQQKYVGSTDDPLSPEGASALAEAPQAPMRVYVSSLRRTSQTAQVVFPGAKRVTVPGLEEMDFGRFETKSHADLECDPDYRAWVGGGCIEACPGGEALDEFSERVCAAFACLLDDASARRERRVVAVVHGGTIMAVMARFALPVREFFEWQVAHGCGYVLDASDWKTRRTLSLLHETTCLKGGVRP